MRKSVETPKAAEMSLTRDTLYLARFYLWNAANRVRPYLGGRRGLILLAIAVLGAGMALNWGWLVAIGVAPVLLAVVPCAAMCALGLCMKGGSKSCSPGDQSAPKRPTKTASNVRREDG